jgi:peptidyl-prolyl cis-trans isomerase C
MTFTRIFAQSAVAILLSTGAMAQETQNADTVLATVNGLDITVGHVIALTNRLPERFQALPDADLYKGVLDQLIQQTALSTGVDTTRKSVRLAIDNETRALLATETLAKVEQDATTEELILAEYAKTYTDAPASMEFNAAHILVETEDEAKALVTDLEGGADFAALAKEKSTGPSGPNGGDLGWSAQGRMVPAFETAMMALDVGAISGPVQTQFGWHVIKLMNKRETPMPPLVEVRVELIEKLRTKAVADHLQSIEKTSDIKRIEIEIDPSIIRKTELLDNQ